MALLDLHPRNCERAREWASLRLDGELSEFERALLDAHLSRCAGCSAYTETVEEATRAIRESSLVSLRAPVSLPARRRVALPLRVYQVAGATAVMVAAVGFGALLGAPSLRESTSASPRPAASGEAVAEDTLIRGPRLAMINAAKGIGTQRGIGIIDI